MVSNFLDAIRPPSHWWPVTHLRSATRTQRRYAAIGAMVGVINMILMLALFKSPTPGRLFFLLLTVVTLSLIPIFPIWGSLGYLTLWIVLLQVPHVPSSDMTITNAAFFFFLAIFLPLRVALILALVVPVALIIPTGPLPTAATQLFLAACTLLPGSILRHTETTLREEVSTATEKLKSIRSEIAREMHDLVAYSMSQTALRAQRAAADPSYPVAAQQEFAAIESTATDALHELRLVLRALRSNEDEHADHAHTTGLGTVVLDLEESVRAVADDLSASGYSVTYQCRGDGHYTRLQTAILSRVLREMSSNVLRHADHDQPVTITLRQDAHKARLVVTNGVLSSHHRFPSSGMGILGMKERLSTVGGSLDTLMDNGTWLTSASIPLSQPPTRVNEDES